MATVHMILQGKGGVGKSFVAFVLAQYQKHQGKSPVCIDADPGAATFHSYQSLKVRRLQLWENEEISFRNFDLLMESMGGARSEDVIIDNSAASFAPLSHYLVSQRIPDLLRARGHRLSVHTIITGGQALFDTMHGFSQLAKQFPAQTDFVVWLNPYFGAIEHEGKGFEEFKTYQDYKQKISALVYIPALNPQTFGYDFATMLKARMTFAEALAGNAFFIIARQRIKMIRDQLFQQLDSVRVLA